jgi:hypothetical protein
MYTEAGHKQLTKLALSLPIWTFTTEGKHIVTWHSIFVFHRALKSLGRKWTMKGLWSVLLPTSHFGHENIIIDTPKLNFNNLIRNNQIWVLSSQCWTLNLRIGWSEKIWFHQIFWLTLSVALVENSPLNEMQLTWVLWKPTQAVT